jgi:hypothetical protein
VVLAVAQDLGRAGERLFPQVKHMMHVLRAPVVGNGGLARADGQAGGGARGGAG